MSQVMQQHDSIDRYGNPKEWKKMKLEHIREYHGPLIRALGISPLDFNMKMPFYDKNGRYVVGLFGSELRKTKASTLSWSPGNWIHWTLSVKCIGLLVMTIMKKSMR